MPRTPTENAVFLGTSAGSGLLLEVMENRFGGQQALGGTMPILLGAGVAAAGIATSMFSQGRMMESFGDGLAGGSLGWTGGKLVEMGLLGGLIGNNPAGGQTQSGGAANVVRVNNPVRVKRTPNRTVSNQSRRRSSSSNNIVEL